MKGVFIPEITVEMLKSASLEAIEDFFSAILDGEATIFDAELPTWIPCSEWLPEKGNYLVWMPFAPPKHRMAIAEYCDGYWNIKTLISAWMPLPKPYDPFSEHMNPPED